MFMRQNITNMQTNFFSPKGALTHFFVSLKNGSLRKGSTLNPKNAKNEKLLGIFLLAVSHAKPKIWKILEFGKVRHSGKTERVSTSDDPTIKIPKPFLPDYKLP